MSILRELKLEPFSLALARKILTEFPAWKPYFGRARQAEAGLIAHVLDLQVPSANRDVRQPLRILADLDRTVTASWFPLTETSSWNVDWVGYAFGHPPADWRVDSSGFDRIVGWLREFTNEERLATVWRQDDGTVLSGSLTHRELAEEELRSGKASVIRSWRGTWDVGVASEVSLPTVIVYGEPDSGMGKLIAEHLGDVVDVHFATEPNLPDTDRLILLDPDWNLSLTPSTVIVACADGRSWTVPGEDQPHPRLFLVRWEGDEWDGPWEEEGSFEVRDPKRDAELLTRHLVAWLREP
jgi:hypothetical protein